MLPGYICSSNAMNSAQAIVTTINTTGPLASVDRNKSPRAGRVLSLPTDGRSGPVVVVELAVPVPPPPGTRAHVGLLDATAVHVDLRERTSITIDAVGP